MLLNARRGSAFLVLIVFSAGVEAQPTPPTIPAGQSAIAVLDSVSLAAPGTMRSVGRYNKNGGATLVKIEVKIKYRDIYNQHAGQETITATAAADGVSFTGQSSFPPPNNAVYAQAAVEITVQNGANLFTFGRQYADGNWFSINGS